MSDGTRTTKNQTNASISSVSRTTASSSSSSGGGSSSSRNSSSSGGGGTFCLVFINYDS